MPTTCTPFRYALATNTTGTSFTAQNVGTTEPSGAGIFDIGASPHGSPSAVPSWIQLMPFGTAADNKTFDMRLYGIVPTYPTDLVTDTIMYVPQLLIDITATACALTFSGHAANTFIADTIVINDGAAVLTAPEHSPWLMVNSPAEDLPAMLLVRTFGSRWIKFDFDTDAGGAASTSCNCMWRPVDWY